MKLTEAQLRLLAELADDDNCGVSATYPPAVALSYESGTMQKLLPSPAHYNPFPQFQEIHEWSRTAILSSERLSDGWPLMASKCTRQ